MGSQLFLKQFRDFLQMRNKLKNWYKASGNKRSGNHYSDYAEQVYDELARQDGAPGLRDCWKQPHLFIEQHVNTTIQRTLEKAEAHFQKRLAQQGNFYA